MARRHDAILLLLCATAGSLDALSFLAFQVFTSAMSGNTVLLGIAVGQRHGHAALAAGVALGCYGAAVLAATPLRRDAPAASALRRLLPIEAALLAAFLAFALALRLPDPGMVALAAAAMGVQAVAAHVLDAPSINTVVFTSTITAIVSALGERRFGRDTIRQLAAFGAYAAGAALGAFTANYGAGAAAAPLSFALAAYALAVGKR